MIAAKRVTWTVTHLREGGWLRKKEEGGFFEDVELKAQCTLRITQKQS